MSTSPSSVRLLAVRAVVAAGIAAAAYGCNGVTNTTAVQCTSEAECLSLGPDFAGTTCSKETRTCVRSAETIGTCSHNQECIDQAGGAAAICRKTDKRCVTLASPECPTIFAKSGVAALANDDAVVIGAMTPTAFTELGTVMERAIELAHFEITSSVVGGLPPLAGQTAARPLVVVACREFGSGREGLLRAAQHLAKDVQVPVVVGPVDPANQGLALTQQLNPNRILSILPAANASSISSLPNPIAPTPIVWRLGIDDRNLGRAPADFLQDQVEPALNAKGITPIKVAYVYSGDVLGFSAAAQIIPRLHFNNATLEENRASSRFLEVNIGNIDDTLNNPNPQATIGRAIAQILAFQPNVIIHTYTPNAITRIYFPIEAGWPGAVARPIHIGANTWNGFGPLLSFMSAGPVLNRYGRTFAVTNWTDLTGATAPFLGNNPNLQAWIQRFNDRNPELSSSPARFFANVWGLYDGVYQAAYAIAALGDKTITGENLAGTRATFQPPKATTVNTFDGPVTGITTAFQAIANGGGVDVNGLSGNMDLDSTGAVNYSAEITCPVVTNGTVTSFKGSGFRYNPAKDASFVTQANGADTPPTGPLLGCPGF